MQKITTTQLGCGWWLCPHSTSPFSAVFLAAHCLRLLSGFGPWPLWVLAESVWCSSFQPPLQQVWDMWPGLHQWHTAAPDFGSVVSFAEKKGQRKSHFVSDYNSGGSGGASLTLLVSFLSLVIEARGWQIFFCKRTNSKYFRVCGTYSLCWNYSVLLLHCESGHRPCVDLAVVCQSLIWPAQWSWELSYLMLSINSFS